MPISQQEPHRLASTPSCCPVFSKSHTSNTYHSYTDLDLKRSSRDELSCDHWQFCEKVPNRSEVEADSLGSTVGLVCSNTTLNNPCGSSPMQQVANAVNFATYLKAFALIYVLPEVDWTEEKIDMLLAEGSDLFRASSKIEQGEANGEENKLIGPEIYTDEEKRIKRNFNLEGHAFTLALEPRYGGVGTKPNEQQPPHTINNLRAVLQNFFKSSRYCLLLTRVGHLLIWRRRKVFFVLDVKGRNKDDLVAVKNNGVAMLVCLKTLDNVVHLASNLSDISPKDEFCIRELVVVRLETPDGRIYMRDTKHRSIDFKVVNKSYAYLKATLHLSLNHNVPVRNRSSLMVAVGSILASKIDHPANWDINMLDRLISYGVELCRSCWSDCLRDRRPIDLDTFPTQLRMGQYVLELKLIPNVRAGHWKCGVRIAGTDFEAHISEALKEFRNLVFQINNQMYAIWIKDGFYYLLDPYRHTILGTHVMEDKAEGSKWATVRMFSDQLTMLSVFHQLLRESNRQSAYYLHVVRIRNLAECPEGFALAPLPEGVENYDVKSLNEPILFNEQQGVGVCDKSLANISDYEDDIISRTEAELDIEKFRLFDEGERDVECEMCEECEFEDDSLKRSKFKMATLKKEQQKRKYIGSFLKQNDQGKIEMEIYGMNKKYEGHTRPTSKKEIFRKSSRQTGGRSNSHSPVKTTLPSTSKEQSRPNRSGSKCKDVSPSRLTKKSVKLPRETGGMLSSHSPVKPPVRFRSQEVLSTGSSIKQNNSPERSGSREGSSGRMVKKDVKTTRQTGGMSPRNSPAKSPTRSKSTDRLPPGRIIKKNIKSPREMGRRSSNSSPSKSPARAKSRHKTIPGKMAVPSPKVAKAKEEIVPAIAPKRTNDASRKNTMDNLVVRKTPIEMDGESPYKAVMLITKAPTKKPTLKDAKDIVLPQSSILQKAVAGSYGLGVAPVATAHLNTPVVSDFVRQLDEVETADRNPTEDVQNVEETTERPIEGSYGGAENHTGENDCQASLLRFPGFNRVPQRLAVAGSESGTMESLTKLLGTAFKVANRVLTMTPWGNYIVFRHRHNRPDSVATWFYLFDGCTCDFDRFRYLDLSCGTAGLIAFRKQSEVVCHIIDSREEKALQMLHNTLADPPHERMQKLLAR
ncbi:uncharacterized protein LOC108108756 [Drosophila eugracilis]|uniref:uncharacterized protein LOC108108756 n=1 Tax=Drosophila eugracilis TaxID=29029 RepID=UPI001BDA3636|nr:uncharacterized protein LOC108108756 [Drosophila eugracilis]